MSVMTVSIISLSVSLSRKFCRFHWHFCLFFFVLTLQWVMLHNRQNKWHVNEATWMTRLYRGKCRVCLLNSGLYNLQKSAHFFLNLVSELVFYFLTRSVRADVIWVMLRWFTTESWSYLTVMSYPNSLLSLPVNSTRHFSRKPLCSVCAPTSTMRLAKRRNIAHFWSERASAVENNSFWNRPKPQPFSSRESQRQHHPASQYINKSEEAQSVCKEEKASKQGEYREHIKRMLYDYGFIDIII